jgi:hypothetical protein
MLLRSDGRQGHFNAVKTMPHEHLFAKLGDHRQHRQRATTPQTSLSSNSGRLSTTDIGERNMTEVEFDRVMEAVGTAITTSDFIESVQAVNENETVPPFAAYCYPVQSSSGTIPGNAEFLQLLLGRPSAEGSEPPPLIR